MRSDIDGGGLSYDVRWGDQEFVSGNLWLAFDVVG